MGNNSNNTCGGNLIEFIRPVIVLRLGGIVSATHSQTVRQMPDYSYYITTYTHTHRESERERE